MQVLKKIGSWFVYSSANPDNLSLTLKALIPALIFFGIKDEGNVFGGAIDQVVQFVSMTGTYIAGMVATYGALRKVWYLVFPKKA